MTHYIFIILGWIGLHLVVVTPVLSGDQDLYSRQRNYFINKVLPLVQQSKEIQTTTGQQFTVLEVIGRGFWGETLLVKPSNKATAEQLGLDQEKVYALKIYSSPHRVYEKAPIIVENLDRLIELSTPQSYILDHLHRGQISLPTPEPGRVYKTEFVLMEAAKGDLNDVARNYTLNDFLLEKWTSNEGRIHRLDQIVRVLLEAVQELHSWGYYHRDLKPQNVFYFSPHLFKLGDLDLMAQMEEDSTSRKYGFRPDVMLAPEQVLRLEHFGGSSDYYQLGLMIYYLATGKQLLRDYWEQNAKEFSLFQEESERVLWTYERTWPQLKNFYLTRLEEIRVNLLRQGVSDVAYQKWQNIEGLVQDFLTFDPVERYQPPPNRKVILETRYRQVSLRCAQVF